MVGVFQRLHLLLSKEGSLGCGYSKIVQLMSLLIYSSHGKNQEKQHRKKESLNHLIKKIKTCSNQPQILSLTWKISLCSCSFIHFQCFLIMFPLIFKRRNIHWKWKPPELWSLNEMSFRNISNLKTSLIFKKTYIAHQLNSVLPEGLVPKLFFCGRIIINQKPFS